MIDKGEIRFGDNFSSGAMKQPVNVCSERRFALESGLSIAGPEAGGFEVGREPQHNKRFEEPERDALLDVIEAREIVEVEIVRLAAARQQMKS